MRPEGCHLPVRVVGEKHAAFEPGVDGLDGGRLAVDFGAERDQFFHQFGVWLRFPAGVGTAVLVKSASIRAASSARALSTEERSMQRM